MSELIIAACTVYVLGSIVRALVDRWQHRRRINLCFDRYVAYLKGLGPIASNQVTKGGVVGGTVTEGKFAAGTVYRPTSTE